jgi:class 3 adenylate cyclase
MPHPPVAEASGERRHVTVMFCDLVASTGIAARLDAEEWRDLVGAYLDAASAAAVEMGGKVAKKLGDGLMALFGYPVAQENDAEQAVRAVPLLDRRAPQVLAVEFEEVERAEHSGGIMTVPSDQVENGKYGLAVHERTGSTVRAATICGKRFEKL